MIVLLAITAGAVGWLTSPRTFGSTAVAVVIPPGSGNPDAMLNPLVNLDNNVAQLAAVLATALRTQGAGLATAAGGTGEFTVETTFGDSPQFAQLTPQLMIQAEARNGDSAQHAVQALVDFAGTTLDKIQADAWVPTHNNAVIVTAVAPQAGIDMSASPARRGAAYAFATLLAGVILLILYDSLQERRRSTGRRSQSASRHLRSTTESRTGARQQDTVVDGDGDGDGVEEINGADYAPDTTPMIVTLHSAEPPISLRRSDP